MSLAGFQEWKHRGYLSPNGWLANDAVSLHIVRERTRRSFPSERDDAT
jgi:hypothetical protein